MLTRTAKVNRADIVRDLPVFPAVALELIDFVDRGLPGASAIAKVLGRDPTLSAEVLRQANSARFAQRRQVGDLVRAVSVLGSDQTCRIAMNTACRGLVAPSLGRPELRSCWEHCLASAVLAGALAPELGLPPGSSYMAGLLHDIGCLALVAVYPDRYVEIVRNAGESGSSWLENELAEFGVHHCTVGMWVVEAWGLPDELLEVVERHHDERPFDRSMLTLVTMASDLAELLQPHPMQRSQWADPEAYLATLPLEEPARAEEIVQAAAERLKVELA